jgi:hypothetical protein
MTKWLSIVVDATKDHEPSRCRRALRVSQHTPGMESADAL